MCKIVDMCMRINSSCSLTVASAVSSQTMSTPPQKLCSGQTTHLADPFPAQFSNLVGLMTACPLQFLHSQMTPQLLGLLAFRRLARPVRMVSELTVLR